MARPAATSAAPATTSNASSTKQYFGTSTRSTAAQSAPSSPATTECHSASTAYEAETAASDWGCNRGNAPMRRWWSPPPRWSSAQPMDTNSPATSERRRRRLASEGVVDRGEEAGRYRGTVALNVALPDWPWELILLALDVWEGCFTFRGTSAFDPEEPIRSPGRWGVATDRSAMHAAEGGGMHGATPTRWHVDFTPSLPDDATEIRVFAGSPVAKPWDHARLPDEPTVVVPLANWPRTPRLVEATVNAPTSRQPTPSEDSVSSLIVDRAVRPDRVIPVSTQLDDGAGGDLCVLAIETWLPCFDLHVASSGWWGGAEARDSSSIWGRHHRRKWWARDDRGGEYWGQYQGGHSASTSAVEVSFGPALDPNARALTLELPSPFDDESVIRSTIELATFGRPA